MGERDGEEEEEEQENNEKSVKNKAEKEEKKMKILYRMRLVVATIQQIELTILPSTRQQFLAKGRHLHRRIALSCPPLTVLFAQHSYPLHT